MEISFNAELQAQLDKLARDAGRRTDELVRDLIAGYVHEVAEIRGTLDRRYDDIKSGKVKLIPGGEIEAYFAAKGGARSQRS